MKEGERLSEEYAEKETQWCRCSGFTCSGCEDKTRKTAKADFLAGHASRDDEVRELQAERDKLREALEARERIIRGMLEENERLIEALKKYENE